MAAPLKAAEYGATLAKGKHVVEWNGQMSESSFHLFVNHTYEPLELRWGVASGDDQHYGTIEPNKNLFVGTYDFHEWRVVSKLRGVVATYSGPSSIVTITPTGFTTERNQHREYAAASASASAANGAASSANGGSAAAAANGASGARSGAGAAGAGAKAGSSSAAVASAGSAAGASLELQEPGYRQRSNVLHMPIWAFDCVGDEAVQQLAHVVLHMLEHCPPEVLVRMREGGASFAVIGRDQKVSDMPPHRFMRYNIDRNLDATARGLGGTQAIPTTSAGEENITMDRDPLYPCQSILVHELGHAVMNIGLDHDGRAAICAAYEAARQAKLYPEGIYMMHNEQEYWATAVEAWFESTVRSDVNGGIKTRAQLRAHDPLLASLLEAAFGDGPWRYHQDCPRPLCMPSRSAARAAAAAAAAAEAPKGAAAAAPGSAGPAPQDGMARNEPATATYSYLPPPLPCGYCCGLPPGPVGGHGPRAASLCVRCSAGLLGGSSGPSTRSHARRPHDEHRQHRKG